MTFYRVTAETRDKGAKGKRFQVRPFAIWWQHGRPSLALQRIRLEEMYEQEVRRLISCEPCSITFVVDQPVEE